MVVIALLFWGINIYGWRSSGVNHVLIFELNPRNHLSEQEVIEFASVFGVIWCLSFLAFMYSSQLGMPPFLNPLILYGLMFAFLINPTKTFRYDARFWSLKVLVFLSMSVFRIQQFAKVKQNEQLLANCCKIPVICHQQFGHVAIKLLVIFKYGTQPIKFQVECAIFFFRVVRSKYF